MEHIITSDSRLFYSKNPTDLYAYSDKGENLDKSYRIKNLSSIKEYNLSKLNISNNINVINDFLKLQNSNIEFIIPCSIANLEMKLINNILYYREVLTDESIIVYRNIFDKWFPSMSAKLYTINSNNEVNLYEDDIIIVELDNINPHDGYTYYKKVHSKAKYINDDMFIFYRNDDKESLYPYYYINNMIKYNNKLMIYEKHVFSGFYDINLDIDKFIKIISNNTSKLDYFIPINNIENLKIIETKTKGILSFISINDLYYIEYKLGKDMKFHITDEIEIIENDDIFKLKNLYYEVDIDNNLYVLPYSNKNDSTNINNIHMSELYKLNSWNDICEDDYYFTLKFIKDMNNIDKSISNINIKIIITDKCMNNLNKYINDNIENSVDKEVVCLNKSLLDDINLFILGNDNKLYYKVNPYKLFKYNKSIYKNSKNDDNYLYTYNSNNTFNIIDDIKINRILSSDGRIFYFPKLKDTFDTSKQLYVFDNKDLFGSIYLNVNSLNYINTYNEFVELHNSISNQDVILLSDEVFNNLKENINTSSYYFIPLKYINTSRIYENKIYYKYSTNYELNKPIYRRCDNIYNKHILYYESKYNKNTFFKINEQDRNLLLKSIKLNNDLFYYLSDKEDLTNVLIIYENSFLQICRKYLNLNYLKNKSIDSIKNELVKINFDINLYTEIIDNLFKANDVNSIELISLEDFNNLVNSINNKNNRNL